MHSLPLKLSTLDCLSGASRAHFCFHRQNASSVHISTAARGLFMQSGRCKSPRTPTSLKENRTKDALRRRIERSGQRAYPSTRFYKSEPLKPGLRIRPMVPSLSPARQVASTQRLDCVFRCLVLGFGSCMADPRTDLGGYVGFRV